MRALDRNELTLAIAGALVGATLLGWIMRWLYERANNGSGPRSIKRTADIAAQLHEAESARTRAELHLAQMEDDLTEARTELSAALAERDRAIAQSEEIRAAYRAAMGDRVE